ncbi:hypothetical protein [Peromfec virus RodF7_22]|uniref:Uncharacterized protein n=1 Tax=Peromfec virus RodF7_22 TaxID=2929270 RepID=A0A976R8U3_9VIRU|nr:hypothetical protein [Peromfec virus RodF7_22]
MSTEETAQDIAIEYHKELLRLFLTFFLKHYCLLNSITPKDVVTGHVALFNQLLPQFIHPEELKKMNINWQSQQSLLQLLDLLE